MRYVYKLQNLINGKTYIGQTKNPAKRKAGHFYGARKGNQRPLYCSIRKHGTENFVFEVLEECADDLIDECEQRWVAHFDSFNPEKGYNLTSGGSQHFNFSEQSCKKIGEANHKRKILDSTRQKLSISAKKHWPQRQKVIRESLQKIDRKGSNSSFWGKHHDDKAKIAMGVKNSIHQSGEGNSSFGKIWMSSVELKNSKLIAKNEVKNYLDQGWYKGRKMQW